MHQLSPNVGQHTSPRPQPSVFQILLLVTVLSVITGCSKKENDARAKQTSGLIGRIEVFETDHEPDVSAVETARYRVAYEQSVNSLGSVHTNTLNALELYCNALVASGDGITAVPLLQELLESTQRHFPADSAHIARIQSLLPTALEIRFYQQPTDGRLSRASLAGLKERLTERKIPFDARKLSRLTVQEAEAFLNSSPGGREILQEEIQRRAAEQERLDKDLAAAEEQYRALEDIRLVDILREQGVTADEARRMVAQRRKEYAEDPSNRQPGETYEQYDRRFAELVRTNLGLPKVVGPTQAVPPRLPADTKNEFRKFLARTAESEPESYELLKRQGLASTFLRRPEEFLNASLLDLNQRFDSGHLPGHISTAGRLEIPATAEEDSSLMSSIVASLKGVVFEREGRLQRALALAEDPIVVAWRNELCRLAGETAQLQSLAFAHFIPTNGTTMSSSVPGYAHFIEVRTKLEYYRALAAGLPGVERSVPITAVDLANHLRPSTVLVDFARYAPDLGGTNILTDYYGASIIYPNRKVTWIRLGEAEQIDRHIDRFHQLIARPDLSDAEATEALWLIKTLSHKLWEPLAPFIPKEVRHLLISPDSKLHLVSFQFLFDGNVFLVQKDSIRLINSPRELCADLPQRTSGRTVSIWADIPYGVRDPKGKGIPGLVYGELVNSKLEAALISKVASTHELTADLHLGRAAMESELQKLHSPVVLHLATHAFILAAPRPAASDIMPELQRREMDRELLPYRTALGFVGMNEALDEWSVGRIAEPAMDGLLTAAEAAQLDLQGTSLVTLSACNSGVGGLSESEGMFSLRRGFHLAGAKNVVAAQWQVEDSYAPTFFQAFYTLVFSGEDPATALTKTQASEFQRLVEGTAPKTFVNAIRLAGPLVISGVP